MPNAPRDRCLPPEMLRQFLANELPEHLETSVLAHLEGCPNCQKLCDNLANYDQLAVVRSKLLHAQCEREPTAIAALRNELYKLDDTVAQPGRQDETQTQAYSPTAATAEVPRNFGGYELLEEIARGGMGVVYKARQIRLDRIVAIKMILAGEFASAEGVRRFVTEAQAAAHLDHPHIVPIYEVGEHAGRHFYSMGYVEGQSLSKLVAQGPLPPREAAELLRKVALAVQYAHDKGVIHRDLKPANVLLDRAGAPRVTDFGLAKRVQGDSELTSTGQVLGTPSYMPPEQARGDLVSIGPHTDIYSLGAILYCLLTGRPPFQSASVIETLKQVLEREPVPPRQLNHDIARDLDTITLKCLDKNPARRYSSAQTLADELDRYLHHRPITARPVSRSERAWRWCRRNPAMAVASTLGVLLLSVAIIVPSLIAAMERDNVLLLQSEHQKVVTALHVAEENELKAGIAEKGALRQAAESILERAVQLCDQNEIPAGLLWMARGLSIARRAEAQELEQAFRWNLGAWVQEAHALELLLPHGAPVYVALFSPDGRTIITGGNDGKVQFWSASSGERLGPPLEHPKRVLAAAFHPFKEVLATCCLDGLVRLWDLNAKSEIQSFRFQPSDAPNFIHPGMAFSPDGTKLLTGGQGKSAMLWEIATGERSGLPLVHGSSDAYYAEGIAYSRDGKRVLVANNGFLAQLWDPESGTRVGPPVHTFGRNTAAAISPDGKTFATAHYIDCSVQIWSAETGQPVGPKLKQRGLASSVAYSPDGKLLVTGEEGTLAYVWDTATGQPVGSPLKHGSASWSVSVANDNRTVLTGSNDGYARVWRLASRTLRWTLPQVAPGTSVVFTPDSRYVAVGIHGDQGRTLAARQVRIWDRRSGEVLPVNFDGNGWTNAMVRGMAFSPDQKLFYAGTHGHVVVWDTARQKKIAELKLTNQVHEVWRLALSPDGTKLAARGHNAANPNGYLWDTTDASAPPILLRTPGDVTLCVAFSPDGRVLWTGHRNGVVRGWNPTTGEEIGREMRFPGGAIMEMAVRPDAKAIVVSNKDVCEYSLDLGEAITRPLVHPGEPGPVAYDSSGELVVTGSKDGIVRIWHGPSSQRIGPLRHHGHSIEGIAVSPDNLALASVSYIDRLAQVWTMPGYVDDAPEIVARWVERLTGQTLSADGILSILDAKSWDDLRLQFRESIPSHLIPDFAAKAEPPRVSPFDPYQSIHQSEP